jgi:hypothetical protein
MSYYPIPQKSNIFNENDYTNNEDDNNEDNENIDNVDLVNYVSKLKTETLTHPLNISQLNFSNGSQTKAFTNEKNNDIINNKEKTSNISKLTHFTFISDLKVDSIQFMSAQQNQPYTNNDKNKIYENDGNILAHNIRLIDLKNQNEFTDIYKNKVDDNETDIINLKNQNEFTDLYKNKINNNETDIINLKNQNEFTDLYKNKINNNETNINNLQTRTLTLENNPFQIQTATAFINMNELLGINSIPHSTLINIEHNFNLGQWINNNTNINFFTGSGLYKYSSGRIEISIQVKLLNKKSYIITALTGLRNYLGEAGDEYGNAIGIDFSLPQEDTSTLQYIDGGIVMKDGNQFEEFWRYNYSCSPFIIESNLILQNNYKLMLKTKLKMQVSPSLNGSKDIKAFITIKSY